MATPISDHERRELSSPYWFEWTALDDVEPDRGPVRCGFCKVRDATHWNYHHTRGAMRYCDLCVEFVSEDDEDWDDEDLQVSDEIWDATVAFIQHYQPVTFTQLVRFLAERGVPVEGDWAITSGSITREFYWDGVSHEVMHLVMFLNVTGEIWYEPTTRETYIEDTNGNPARLPDSEYWVPVLIVAGYDYDA